MPVRHPTIIFSIKSFILSHLQHSLDFHTNLNHTAAQMSLPSPNPELHPLFEPDVLYAVHELRQQFEEEQLVDALDGGGNEPEPLMDERVGVVLDRFCRMLQEVREEQRGTRQVLERLIAILGERT